jgi:hypothetical protein
MPPPLPEKIEEWQRFLKQERTLNDLVEDIHRILVSDEDQGPAYRALLRAVYDEQARRAPVRRQHFRGDNDPR